MGRPTIPDGPRVSKKDEASGESGDGKERTKQKGAGPESGKQESKEQESEEREYTGQESESEADRQAEALARALSAAAIVTEGEEERRRPDTKRQTQSGRRRKRPTSEIPGREAEKTRRRERGAVPGGAKSRESGAEAGDFDDRREETELAAAARSVIVRLDEYRRRIWEARKRRWVRLALVAVLVLGILFGTTQAVKYWTYGSYAVESPASGEDTVSAYYQKVGDRVLKYGLDGVSMTKEDGTTLWSAAYTMNAPVAVSCGEAVAIYDSQGTNIRIYNAEGEIGNISTNIPIIKAKVASQGVAAAILESGEETWIQYYSPKGEQIASVKTTLDSTGYPLDLALSEDGLLMAVSYLQIADGTPKTELCFYNFSSIGQNQTDNLANSYTIENVIAPQVEYLDEQTCLLLREDGFSIYEGKQIPKQSEEVKLEQEIISAFHSDSRVGFITKSENAQQAYTLRLFDKRGRELFQEDFDFAYESVFMDERQIVLYNSNQMCVYSLDGVKKFEGDLKEGMVRDILPVGAYQYLLITEEGTCAIRLKH